MAEREYIALAAGRSIEAEHATWATVRTAASGDIETNYGPTFYLHQPGSWLTGGVYHIRRHAMFFDLSNLPSGFTITAAVLKLFVTYKGTSGDIVVVQGLQDNPVNVNDYGDLYSAATSGGSAVIGDMTTDQYNSITLNATGIGWLTPGQSVVKLALRGSIDVEQAGAPGVHTSVIYFHSTQKGTGYEPILVLTAAKQYPSDSMARVSSIRHICRPGFYRMQVGLGDIGFDIDVAEATVRAALDTAKEAELEEAPPAEPTPILPGPKSAEPTAMEKLIGDALRQQEADSFPASARITAPQPLPSRVETEPSLWQRITPWKEEAGETFGGEIAERIKSFTGWIGGLFK